MSVVLAEHRSVESAVFPVGNLFPPSHLSVLSFYPAAKRSEREKKRKRGENESSVSTGYLVSLE